MSAIATVRVAVDLPGAEGVWVFVEHVHPGGGTIAEALERAGAALVNQMALDAAALHAEREARAE